jgi:CheY-like chemotaxis protein
MVLLDYLLPEMSGELVFENLQRLNPDVRVVLLTGCEESVADKMLKKGLRGSGAKRIYGLMYIAVPAQEIPRARAICPLGYHFSASVDSTP